MSEASKPPWKRVPWIVWALLVPALLLGGWQLWTGGGKRIHVVGSGVLTELSEDDALEGTFYDLSVVPDESLAKTRERVEEQIAGWPDILVFALDDAVPDDEAAAAYEALATAAENATTVPVIVGRPNEPEAFRTDLRAAAAGGAQLRVCVTPGDDVAGAVAGGVREGRARLDALRATTQVGR